MRSFDSWSVQRITEIYTFLYDMHNYKKLFITILIHIKYEIKIL